MSTAATHRAPGGHPNDLDAAWCHLEAWYAARGASHLLLPGACDDDLDRAQARLGLEFPAPLRASLRRHDGSRRDGWANGTLLSAGSIVAATELWRRTAERGEDVPRELVPLDAARGLVQRCWWHRGWIAIDEDGHGRATAIDTAPGPAGRPGQVLGMAQATGAAVVAGDIVAFLHRAAVTLARLRVVDGDYLDAHDVWDGIVWGRDEGRSPGR